MLWYFSWLVFAAYLITAFLYWKQFVKDKKDAYKTAGLWLTISVVIHSIFLLCIIFDISRLPIATVSESIQTFVWITATLYLFLEKRLKEYSQGALILSLLVIMLFISNISFNLSSTINPILYDVKFESHVFFMLLANSGFMLAFIAGILYLLLSNEIKKKELGIFFRRLPSLVYFEKISNYAINIGLIFLTIGFALGFYSATQVWSESMLTEPKILSVVVTLMIYFTHYIGRLFGKIRGQRAAMISTIGFISILISFLIVSQIIPSEHQFG